MTSLASLDESNGDERVLLVRTLLNNQEELLIAGYTKR
jgi:hypothetical protein